MSLRDDGPTPGRTALPERNLDMLRATAVLAVLAEHLGVARDFPPVAWYGHWAGRCGVLMFFVHTSLVLMASLERNHGDPHWVRSFYVRRGFRIYPLAIVAILLMLTLRIPPVNSHSGVIRPFVMPDWPTILANLALAQNLFGLHKVGVVLWTLPLEVQMYVLLPLCYLVARRGARATAALFVAAMLVYAFTSRDLVANVWRINDLALFAPCFVSGVLAYALLRSRRWRPVLPAAAWGVALPVSIAVMVAFVRADAPVAVEWAYTLALALAIPLTRELEPSRLTRAARTVATYSYGLYLAHVPALWAAFVVLHAFPAAVQWLALATLLIALPYAGYWVIEKPGIDFGSRILRRRVTLAATAPAP